LLGAHERRFRGITATFGYEYFDYIDYLNYDDYNPHRRECVSSSEAMGKGPRDKIRVSRRS
jgi:hypothetical protein